MVWSTVRHYLDSAMLRLVLRLNLDLIPTVGLVYAAIKVYDRDQPRDMAEPVHKPVTAMM